MQRVPNVALVVDALPGIGGAEKLVMSAAELFPEAPIFTLVYNRPAFRDTPLAARRVITSYIDRLPGAPSGYRKYLPLLPHAIRNFDLSGFDVVLSFSYAVAHGVRLQPGQRHLSYTFTPMRYAWRDFGLNGKKLAARRWTQSLFCWFRTWDAGVVGRVERMATVSHHIRQWVRRVYQREARVIYPPVDVERFKPGIERGDYYVSVARLVPHKRVDLVVEAFNRLGLPLLVVGDGPMRGQLERSAGENIHFTGFLGDEIMADLLGGARAFVSASEEDFGMAVVEAQAAGCPVIAYGKGGALETVTPGQSGMFFDEPCPESLAEAVGRFARRVREFDPLHIASCAQRFNKERFLRELGAFTSLPYLRH